MRAFTAEDLNQIKEDWRRNENLAEPDRLDRVCQLNACSEEEAANALGIPLPGKKKKAKRYDRAVKDDAIKAVLLNGEPRQEVAERMGLAKTTLDAWIRQAQKKQKEFLDYPEPVAENTAEPERPDPAASEECCKKHNSSQVNLKELRDAIDGLCDFVDIFCSCGFLCEKEALKLEETIDQACHYVRGIEWVLSGGKV